MVARAGVVRTYPFNRKWTASATKILSAPRRAAILSIVVKYGPGGVSPSNSVWGPHGGQCLFWGGPHSLMLERRRGLFSTGCGALHDLVGLVEGVSVKVTQGAT